MRILAPVDRNTLRGRQCGRKVAHETEAQAKKQAKILHKRKKMRFEWYQCRWCNLWHVGAVRSVEAAKRRCL